MADDLWFHFDRIRAFLLKQESKRGDGAWLVSALPHIARHLEAVTAAEDECYGAAYCAWLDWLDARKLAWRGRLQWQIPMTGPVIFTPPSSEEMYRRLGELIRNAGLEEYTRRMSQLMTAGVKVTKPKRGRKKANA